MQTEFQGITTLYLDIKDIGTSLELSIRELRVCLEARSVFGISIVYSRQLRFLTNLLLSATGPQQRLEEYLQLHRNLV
jgi:hypothetical protein